jgi:hypothetical protein
MRRTLLGSVSREVASQATCTVTVVRCKVAPPPGEAAEAKDDSSWTVG